MPGVKISLLLLLLLPAACQHKQPCGHFIPQAFLDFTYVGEFPVQQPPIGPHHPVEPAPLPAQFRRGYSYAFIPNIPIQTSEFPVVVLPQLLTAAGVTVVSAPRSANDMAIPNIGGPTWELRFKSPACSGSITNSYNAKLAENRHRLPYGAYDTFWVRIE